MKLLYLSVSPKKEGSSSKYVAQKLIDRYKQGSEDLVMDYIDLFKEHLPDVTPEVIDIKGALAAGKEPDIQHIQTWEAVKSYIQRFLSADIIVISTPMWNFGIPYKLKHFIDIIMQPGYLFKYTSKGPVGLAGGKKLYLISSRGSDYSPGSAFHDFDHIGRYFETIFKFIGLEDYRFIDVQPMDAQGPDIRNAQIKRAVETVEKLI